MGSDQIKLIIAQSYISNIQRGFQYKLNNSACRIVPYPKIEVKHTSEKLM